MNQSRERMSEIEALQVLARNRRDDQIVVTNQGSSRLWPEISNHPLDFNYNPSTMGGAIPFAVGLALGCPAKEIIVCSGDGSLLMSMGSLVTVIASRVRNLTVLLMDNGVYGVTGGQKTAASQCDIDYAAVAQSIGFLTMASFHEPSDWQRGWGQMGRQPGPRFVRLAVQVPDDYEPVGYHEPMEVQLKRLMDALKLNAVP